MALSVLKAGLIAFIAIFLGIFSESYFQLFNKNISSFWQVNPVTNDKWRVLFFGDSISHGHDHVSFERMPYNDIYVNELQRLFLTSKNPFEHQIKIVTEGLNARTINNPDIGAWPYTLSLMDVIDVLLHSHKPLDLVVIMLGINDQKEKYHNTIETLTESLKLLSDKIINSNTFRKTNKYKKILYMVPVISRLTKETEYWGWRESSILLNDKYPEMFNNIKNIYNGTNNVIMDVFNPNDYVVAGKDGVHIDPENNHKLARNLAPKIVELLKI